MKTDRPPFHNPDVRRALMHMVDREELARVALQGQAEIGNDVFGKGYQYYADLPQQRYGDFAEAVAGYVEEVKRLAEDKRDAARSRARLLEADAYRLAADPTRPDVAPPPLPEPPPLDLAALERAATRLKASAAAFDQALSAEGPRLAPARRRALEAAVQPIEQALLRDEGLPGRPWYRNLVYAPAITPLIVHEWWAHAPAAMAVAADAVHLGVELLTAADGVGVIVVETGPNIERRSRTTAGEDGVGTFARGHGFADRLPAAVMLLAVARTQSECRDAQ